MVGFEVLTASRQARPQQHVGAVLPNRRQTSLGRVCVVGLAEPAAEQTGNLSVDGRAMVRLAVTVVRRSVAAPRVGQT